MLSARGQRVADKDVAGGALELEVIILPLNHRGRTNARVVGALAPVETPYWLGASPLGPLTLGTHRYLDPGLTTRSAASAPGAVVRTHPTRPRGL